MQTCKNNQIQKILQSMFIPIIRYAISNSQVFPRQLSIMKRWCPENEIDYLQEISIQMC